ncbi:MAG: hypothetical protein HKP27_15035 [Myxococcales bacterium]|nr:hypothetical protein [Myxococcales bacterium]
MTTTTETAQRSTLLDLVGRLLDQGASEQDVVARARQLILSGQVVLSGNFAGAGVHSFR